MHLAYIAVCEIEILAAKLAVIKICSIDCSVQLNVTFRELKLKLNEFKINFEVLNLVKSF